MEGRILPELADGSSSTNFDMYYIYYNCIINNDKLLALHGLAVR